MTSHKYKIYNHPIAIKFSPTLCGSGWYNQLKWTFWKTWSLMSAFCSRNNIKSYFLSLNDRNVRVSYWNIYLPLIKAKTFPKNVLFSWTLNSHFHPESLDQFPNQIDISVDFLFWWNHFIFLELQQTIFIHWPFGCCLVFLFIFKTTFFIT